MLILSRTFGDVRSGRIALIPHCILNQNSIVPGLARRPSMVKEVIDILDRYGIGIIQLPCPETLYLGLRRFWQVKEQYSCQGFRLFCRRLVRQVVNYVAEYRRCGYDLVLVLGIAGSPSCGIYETTSSNSWFGNPISATSKERVRGSGVFMEELLTTLRKLDLLKDCLILDFNYSDIGGSLLRLESRLKERFLR